MNPFMPLAYIVVAACIIAVCLFIAANEAAARRNFEQLHERTNRLLEQRRGALTGKTGSTMGVAASSFSFYSPRNDEAGNLWAVGSPGTLNGKAITPGRPTGNAHQRRIERRRAARAA
jgi:hypothetical protein